jgi:hypothetical protein
MVVYLEASAQTKRIFLIATVLLFFNIHSEDQRQLLKRPAAGVSSAVPIAGKV